MKRNSILKTIMTIAITGVVTFTVASLWHYGKVSKNDNNEETIGKALASDSLSTKLQVIKDKIDNSYIGETDEDNLKEYAIKGYVAGLDDDYSQYFTKEEMKKYTESTLGSYVGIGIYMYRNQDENTIVVQEVMEDSPAEKAGVQSGDIIKKVDDKEITADDFEEISSLIEGKAGTKVKIAMLREENEIIFDINREKIQVKSAEAEMLSNNIGYILVSSFDGDVSNEFKNCYDGLIKQGMKSLIIDLRNNGGGIAKEAVEIGDYFCDKGKTLLIQEDKNRKEEISNAESDKIITMDTVVLVNEYSASASEILAGILKENVDNATLVGVKTFGKGVIQSLYKLSDGSGLKLTTNKYFTPNHNEINKVGITPDIETEKYKFSKKSDKENDIQLKKAIEILKK